MCAIWEAVGEYQLNRDIDHYEPEVFASFLILVAVKLNYRDIVERIWKDGCSAVSLPCASPEDFNTKLRQAAEDLAAALLSNRQEWTPSSMTLFSWAACNDHHAVVTALLSQIGIITTEKDVRWWYSLRNVVGTGDMKAGMLFLFHGRSGSGLLEHDELHVAARCGHEAMVDRLLAAGANIYTHGVLNAAVRGGQDTILDKLLEAGADINSESLRGGDTVLGIAAQMCNRSMVDKLLEAGANVNALGVLYSAFLGGDQAIIERLLTAGARICPGLLVELVGRGHRAAIDRVIKAGVDVNTPGVLEAAIKRGDKKIVEKLIEAGANVNAPGVLYAAIGRGNQAIFDILRVSGAT